MQEESTQSAASSDEDLLGAIQSGDHAAYKALVERYLMKLWRLSVNVLHDEAAAEDVVQDVFLGIWKSHGAWDISGPAKFSTWIYRITLNRCIDYKRRQKPDRDHVLDENMPSEETVPADKQLFDKQQSKNLALMLKKLNEKQRLALVLFYYDDLTIKEISDKMHTTEAGARSLLKRARKALKLMLERSSHHESEKFQGQTRPIRRRSLPLAGGPARASTDSD